MRKPAPARPDANPYGWFDAEAREYVVVRPDTPTPWLNYIGAGGYGGIVSNTGGGFSFDRDPRHRRVTRYRYNGVPVDQPGRYVYLRDQETGEFWSATWEPVRRGLDGYECRHGPGYTRIRGAHGGIEHELTYFVPPGRETGSCPCELWVLRVRNRGDGLRQLRSFTYAEFSQPDAVADQQNLDWSQHVVTGRLQDGAILVGTRFSPTTAFFASGTAPLGYTANREDFVGRSHDLADPIVVATGAPSNAGSPRGNSIGSLCHALDLAPGEERRLVFILGLTDRPAEIPRVVARYAHPAAADTALEELRAGWDSYLSHLHVETPDREANAMLNVWNQVQCRTTLYWSRFVSGYESGLGRGMGTRDSAQDTLGTVHAEPEAACRTLTRLWALQFRDGHAWHQFFPLTGEGGPGLAAEMPAWPQWFSDDHLWLVIATCVYVRETGDTAFLERRVAWADGEAPREIDAPVAVRADEADGTVADRRDDRAEAEGSPDPAAADTVWGHMLRAIEFTLARRGPHGLPRPGYADWDDTLNVDHGSGEAESVWCGMQFCRAVLDLAELSDHLERGAAAARFRALHAGMAAALNDAGWDGRWYTRAFDDAGRPVGVAGEAHHAINLNPQTWAVIGEVGPRERTEGALESAEQMLDTPLGVALLAPPYDGWDERVRGTSTYPPGAKENGGIFCHANAWLIVAEAMLGRGDDAYRHYRRLLPLGRTDADRYLAEPYVYAQNLCGPAHPQFGMARNSWLTGTAAWMFVAATQWILGIRPTHRGLRIAPSIPEAWPGFRAHRDFRGVAYEIEVRRAGPGTSVSLCVDGRPIQGDVVPLPTPGARTVHVKATLG